MKSSFFLLLIFSLSGLRAEVVSSFFTTQPITLSNNPTNIDFGVLWSGDIFPVESEPGRVELVNDSGSVVASATAHLKQPGPDVTATSGAVTVTYSNLVRLAQDMSVADGDLSVRWQLPALPAGAYTLRLWSYTSQSGFLENSTVQTQTLFSGISEISPTTFTLTTSAGPGGSVTPGGPQAANSWATVTATADGSHDFAVWSGDASGTTNPLSMHMTTNRAVQANFSIKSYVLSTYAGAGGSVTPGGTYPYGTNVTLSALPDATHQFTGWSGDASGTLNPLTLQMTAHRNVQANFMINTYVLSTYAGPGGSVTPGGSYPHGTSVTLSAAPDVTHQFLGWIGAINGTVPTITVLMDGPKSVQAVFAAKLPQTIDFPAVPSVSVGGTVSLVATASSGLPVNFRVASGPGLLTGNTLVLNGPDPVVIEATQTGSPTYLAAPPIIRTVQAFTIATLRYQSDPRTLLQTSQTLNSTNFVLNSQP